jgi:hypothetical protein
VFNYSQICVIDVNVDKPIDLDIDLNVIELFIITIAIKIYPALINFFVAIVM